MATLTQSYIVLMLGSFLQEITGDAAACISNDLERVTICVSA